MSRQLLFDAHPDRLRFNLESLSRTSVVPLGDFVDFLRQYSQSVAPRRTSGYSMDYLENQAAKIMANRAAHQTMSVHEAAYMLRRKPPTIYRWLQIGKLVRTGVRGQITTASVLAHVRPRKKLPE
jgi:hypothetical protein